jgi:hypothetical protein
VLTKRDAGRRARYNALRRPEESSPKPNDKDIFARGCPEANEKADERQEETVPALIPRVLISVFLTALLPDVTSRITPPRPQAPEIQDRSEKTKADYDRAVQLAHVETGPTG